MDAKPHHAQPHHDAYSPREIAHRVKNIGVAKAQTDTLTLLVLAVLAGAFISLGALFFLVVTTGSTLGFGATPAGRRARAPTYFGTRRVTTSRRTRPRCRSRCSARRSRGRAR